ncbi:hypothetical protein QG37_06745 [Candidozyma auris]|uniref:Uncharacterized protein n=1 Tax=Candidozyma auris TaxID=498019 RepID=A0A0L0NT76_CANAR|nr:hypothetical protein QG37_06745 [[Candida] auris]
MERSRERLKKKKKKVFNEVQFCYWIVSDCKMHEAADATAAFLNKFL